MPLDRLDALVPRSDGLTKRSLEALISFDRCVCSSGAAIGGSDTSSVGSLARGGSIAYRSLDVTAGVDEYILGLGDKVARQRAGTLARLRRNEPSALHRQQRIFDVIDAQPGVEISQVNQIARLIPPRAAIYRTINDQLTLTD